MNAVLHAIDGADADLAPTALLRTLVVCDLVDSTRILGALGDRPAAELIRKHDRMARALLAAHRGREIDKTDGFLLMFERPVQAVAFALDYLRELRAFADAEHAALAARVGIHVGDVVAWDNAPGDVARGAKPVEVEGLVKAIAARLMQLALPNQILLSGVAHALAHRAQGELGARLQTARWRTHGRYRFKGVPDPVPVFEVGEEGFAPLKPPPWSGKAHREVPFWRRPATLGIEIAVLALLLLVPAWYLLRPVPAIAFAQRDWVVVGDLQNLTDDVRFNDAVDTAFRVGLEQSRYVNVLSSLKARETIARMQRDPDATRVDRAIGAEIALRDGARALILPTLADIGGRVRITVEVVDPRTQTTVWSESADGRGAESVLPSLDRLNRQLRERLGEALASVSETTQPLQQVTTANLDSLRAYSLALGEQTRGEYSAAASLLQMAIDNDPQFALAHATLGLLLSDRGKTDEALREYRLALSFKDRLSARESAYVQALLADHDVPAVALQQWRRLATMYPDFFRAQGARAMAEYQLANDFPAAATAAARSADTKNRFSPAALHLLGILALGEERYADAAGSFEAAGIRSVTQFHAANFAAQRDFDAARRILGTVGEADLGRAVFRAVFEADQGRIAEALQALQEMGKRPQWSADERRRVALSALGLAALSDTGAAGTAALREQASRFAGDDARFERLATAYLLARAADTRAAGELLASVPEGNLAEGWPILDNMRKVAAAEIASRQGDPRRAIDLLAGIPATTALYVTHVAAMDAAAAAGDDERALNEARWLVAHRGRAYTEYGSEWALVPFNVVMSDLAQLRIAELEAGRGRTAEARAAAERFRANWSAALGSRQIAERLQRLQPGLHGPAG